MNKLAIENFFVVSNQIPTVGQMLHGNMIYEIEGEMYSKPCFFSTLVSVEAVLIGMWDVSTATQRFIVFTD